MTADIAQAEEAATKLLEGDSDKSMQKFQAKNADFFGEYANARSATGHTEIFHTVSSTSLNQNEARLP
jgi:uncharacterized protein YhfF